MLWKKRNRAVAVQSLSCFWLRGWDGWMASLTQWIMNLSKPLEIVKDREGWHAAVRGITKTWNRVTEQISGGAGLPRWLSGEEANAGDAGHIGSILGLGRSPGGGNGNLLQYSCQRKSYAQRSLMGWSPWGCQINGTNEHRSGGAALVKIGR